MNKRNQTKQPSQVLVFIQDMFKENPVFVLGLGLVPALAVTASFEAAIGMGTLIFVTLILNRMLLKLIHRLILEEIQWFVYIILLATQVVVIQMLVEAFIPNLFSSLGIYLALMTVNGIVFILDIKHIARDPFTKLMRDNMKTATAILVSLMLIGFLREFIGTGMIVLGQTLPIGFDVILFEDLGLSSYALSVFKEPVGAFIIVGLLAALFSAKRYKEVSQ